MVVVVFLIDDYVQEDDFFFAVFRGELDGLVGIIHVVEESV